MTAPVATRVVYLVVCAAPPARRIDELVDLLSRHGWRVYVIATPTAAAGWVDAGRLAAQTGFPVRSQARRPGDPRTLPEADAIAVVPATFNTINKWAAGISDTFALGILNEAVGIGVPIVVSPYVKSALAAHPAFGRSLALLSDFGVRFTAIEALRPGDDGERFAWPVILDALSDGPR